MRSGNWRHTSKPNSNSSVVSILELKYTIELINEKDVSIVTICTRCRRPEPK